MESIETQLSPEEDRRWRQNERHGALLAWRLGRLVHRGYRPLFDADMRSFELIHPNRKATPIELWADGQLVDSNPTAVKDGNRTIIYPEDEELFSRFLARVPAPNPLQKLSAMRVGELSAYVTTWVVIYLAALLMAKCSSAVWSAVTDR